MEGRRATRASDHAPGHARLVTLVLAVAVSVASATLTTLLLTPDAIVPGGEEGGARQAVEVSDASGVLERNDDVARDVERLRARLAALEGRRAPVGGYVTRTELEALGQKVGDDVRASIRRDEAVGSRHQKIEARVRDRERILQNRAKNYGLNAAQTIEMRALEIAWEARDREVIRMWDAGIDAAVIRETERSNEDEYQAAFNQILDPAQLERRRQRIEQHGWSFVRR